MAQDKNDTYRTDEKSTTETGSDIPGGDGTISDEDMDQISGGKKGAKTGQDHSTENREDMMPTSGVGAIQDSSDTSSDIAHIEGENE
jgi:uncharacterized protein YhfF